MHEGVVRPPIAVYIPLPASLRDNLKGVWGGGKLDWQGANFEESRGWEADYSEDGKSRVPLWLLKSPRIYLITEIPARFHYHFRLVY